MSDPVLVERRGHVLIVTIHRPEARNAVNNAVAAGIAAAMETLDSDDSLRVGVITGAGGTFCAGMDLKGFARGETAMVPTQGFAGIVEQPPRKPLIAAVEGYALAGGFEVVLACDLVVSSSAAMFGLLEVRRGLIAGGGGLLRLPLRIPRERAMLLSLTGRQVGAEELSSWGLISVVTQPGGALEAALALANEIADNAPLAVLATKEVIVSQERAWLEEGFTRQIPLVERILASDDAREGAVAFAERRQAEWQGR